MPEFSKQPLGPQDNEDISARLSKPTGGEVEARDETAQIEKSDAVADESAHKEEGYAVKLSARRTKLVNICTDDRTSNANVNSLLDTKSSSPNLNYSNCPRSSPDKESEESSRKCDSSTKIWYLKSTATNVPNPLDLQNQDCSTERCETVGKTDNNLDERSFNSSCSTETESHVLNFNDNSQQADTPGTNISQRVNTESEPVLNITKEMKNPIDTKCKEIIPIPIEQNLNTIVDKQKLPDERGIPTSSITRLEGQIITNHPNKDLNNHGCHLTEKQLLDHAKSIQHNRKSASNDAHQIESEKKCTEQSVDNRKGYNKNAISLSHQVVETHNSTNEGMPDVSSIEKHGSNVLITIDSNETSHFIHENDHNSSDKEMSQTDGVGVIDAKKSETNDDVICDKQHANNLELCDANVLISSNPRYDSVGNPIDTNDDLLATHGKLVTPGANSNSASNSHLNEIIPNCEGTLINSRENRPRIICDKSESLLYHSSGHSTGDKLVVKEALKETVVNSNTKYQKNIIGFLRPFKSQKKEQGMRNCKSLVFDKMESEELLKDKHMAGSYGNLRKPTIQAAGNQRRRCISSSCENENKRYVALRNDFEEDVDEQLPNSPISNSKKTISLSTITLTKLRNNNQKIQRKIDNILTKSWRSILTVQNSRSSQDISDGSRGKPFYKNPYGTRSVINVNSNIIYKQPAYSKSWTEISGCMHETRKKNSGHYASNVCRQGAAPKSPLASSSSDEVIPESPMPRLAKLREFSSSASSVSGGPRSGSFSSEPLKPVNRLRVPSLCEDGAPSKMCSRCSSLLSMAASSKYSVSSLAGYVSVPAPVSSGEPVAGGSSGDVLCKVCLLEVPHKDSWTLSDCHCTYCLEVRIHSMLFILLLHCPSVNLGIYPSNLGIYPYNLGIYPSNLDIYPSNLGVHPSNLGSPL